MDIKIELSKSKKIKPSKDTKLGFGKIPTDHMFIMNYEEGKGWFDPRIVPYGPISLNPSAMVFHYGQEVFEGLKAYRDSKQNIYLFRPDMNAKRMAKSCEKLRIPVIPEDMFVEAVKAIVKIEKDWIPEEFGTSLYIRPFIIATEERLGVAPSKSYLFMIIVSPSANYYADGLKPVSIWVENDEVRAIRGGIGFAKTGGNYAASLNAQAKAHEEGYSQVLWLDGVHRKYIEEVGAMNIFFKIDGVVITPKLNGSILAGITRDSVLKLCEKFGYKTEERLISIDEILTAQKEGKLEEVFGTGTAATISPVGHLRYVDDVFQINDGGIGPLSQKLYDTLLGIQNGSVEDYFGWKVVVDLL